MNIFIQLNTVGAYYGQGTPVPIPNTVVKLIRAENTRMATSRKNRSAPTQKKNSSSRRVLFFVSFIRLSASYIAGQLYCLRQWYSLREFEATEANKIPLRAKRRNTTFAMQKYHSDVRRNTTYLAVFFTKFSLVGAMVKKNGAVFSSVLVFVLCIYYSHFVGTPST